MADDTDDEKPADKEDGKADKSNEKVTITFSADRSAQTKLAERAQRQMPRGAPMDLGDTGRSVQFLRAVGSRAGFALSAFYLFIGSDISGRNECTIPDYPGKVLQSYVNFSSINTMALACRKVFDHGTKDALTGAVFAKQSDQTLLKHAEYWAKSSKRPVEDAYRALTFLRALFAICARSNSLLFKDGTTLGRRIGLLKQYADRTAAHLSLEPYEFDILDVAHVVAALTLIGDIIRSFDNGSPDSYFNEIDAAAHKAAVALFPDTPEIRLFQNMKVEMQARLCWQWDHASGLHMMTEQLPYAISWF